MAKTQQNDTLDTIVALAIRGEFSLDAFLGGDMVGIDRDVLDVFDEDVNEMEGVVPRLPQIGIVHQGQMFKMPDGSKVAEFDAWVVDSNAANAWWEVSFDESGGGTPPDCFSLDGLIPDPSSPKIQAQSCLTCPRNQFGSAGRGKACKNMRRVHTMLPGSGVPHRLTLSPANLVPWGDFLTQEVQGKKLRLLGILVHFSLRPETNQDGIEYSAIVASVVKDPDTGKPVILATTKEQARSLNEFRKQWMDAMRGQMILSGEMGAGHDGDDAYDVSQYSSDGDVSAADLAGVDIHE